MSHDETTRFGRRDALKLGGLTVSVAALAAACGTDRAGDDAPGRGRSSGFEIHGGVSFRGHAYDSLPAGRASGQF